MQIMAPVEDSIFPRHFGVRHLLAQKSLYDTAVKELLATTALSTANSTDPAAAAITTAAGVNVTIDQGRNCCFEHACGTM